MTGQDYSLGPRIAADDRGLLAHILGLRPHGTALEFGVGEGHTLRMIAQQMPVIGFDSFTGLPEDWRPEYPKGAFAWTAYQRFNTFYWLISVFTCTLIIVYMYPLRFGWPNIFQVCTAWRAGRCGIPG